MSEQLWRYQMMVALSHSPDVVKRFEYIATPDSAGLAEAYREAHRRYPEASMKGVSCFNGGSWSMSRHWDEWAISEDEIT